MSYVKNVLLKLNSRSTALGLLMAIFVLLFTNQMVFAAEDQYQGVTYEGRLYNAAGTAPLAEPVTFKFQIYNETQDCLLYEEQQTADLTSTDGFFSLMVGSPRFNLKRTASDPQIAMTDIFQNAYDVAIPACPTGTFSHVAGSKRILKVSVTPSSIGVVQNLTPDMEIGSIPSALVCESLQGYGPNMFLIKTGGAMTGQLTMAAQNSISFDDAAGGESVIMRAPTTVAADWTMTLPASAGTAGFFLQTDGAGNTSWASAAGGGSSGITSINGLNNAAQTLTTASNTGTAPHWNSVGTNHDLRIPLASAAGVTAGLISNGDWTYFASKQNALAYTPVNRAGDTMTNTLTSPNIRVGSAGEIRFYDPTYTNYVGIKASGGALSNVTWSLPTGDGTANQALVTNGSGTLGWTSILTAASAGISSINGQTIAAQGLTVASGGTTLN
jgi:hypothetical protein